MNPLRNKKLQAEILNVINKRLNTQEYKVFLFGSWPKNNNFERSDIDLGILGKQKIDADTFLQIQEELNNLPYLQKFDLVDFQNVSQKFQQEALRHTYYLS